MVKHTFAFYFYFILLYGAIISYLGRKIKSLVKILSILPIYYVSAYFPCRIAAIFSAFGVTYAVQLVW